MASSSDIRQVTFSLPDTLLGESEELARSLHMELGTLVEKALRGYLLRWEEVQRELNEPIDPRDPDSMSLAQVSE